MLEQFSKSGFLALILAILGWYIVYKNSRILAKKTECNSLANDIDKLLQEISSNSYDFWREREIEDGTTFLTQCRIFELNIGHMCDLIEDKINYLNQKTIEGTIYQELCDEKINNSIKLLADVREKSTLDSERLLDSNFDSQKHRRIANTHAATIKLSKEIHSILSVRYEAKNTIYMTQYIKHHFTNIAFTFNEAQKKPINPTTIKALCKSKIKSFKSKQAK